MLRVGGTMRLAGFVATLSVLVACVATTQSTNSTSCTPGQLCFCVTS
jgi:hypothetical protein